MSRVDEILEFWFGKGSGDDLGSDKFGLWFAQDDALDDRIRDEFGSDVEAAAAGDYDSWKESDRGRLALLILLDQFTRNIFRGRAQAFANDPQALELAVEGIEEGVDKRLHAMERVFMYLPLEHAEDRSMQARSVALFEELLDDAPEGRKGAFQEFLRYARLHKDVIDAYGRFPHRNAILERESTPDEIAYLADPNRPY